MKPIRFFLHVACESPGYLGEIMQRRGYPYELVCLGEGRTVPQDLDAVAGLVVMGGPGNVNAPTDWMAQELELIRRAAEKQLPVLGICLGAQLISKALGGEVCPSENLEVGWHQVERLDHPAGHQWLDGLPPRFEVFQWHAHTFSLPPGAVALARGACAEQQAFAIQNMLAIQFHIENTRESIQALVERYPGDLELPSECVDSAAAITADLAERIERLYGIAEVLFGGWVDRIHAGDGDSRDGR